LKPYAVSFPSVRARVVVAALLLLLKLAVSFVVLRHGLQASYFAAPQWKEPTVSRIDARVSLGRQGDPVVPALSAVWQGYAPVRSGADRQAFYLRGNGVTAELWVDGFQAVHLEPLAEEEIQRVAGSAAAVHRLVVRMTAPPGHSPQFDAGFVTDGAMVPFEENDVLVRPAPPWRIALDRAVRPLSPWLDGLLVALLAWIAWHVVDFMVPPEEQ
jgi:hypothetical protein